jgi:protein MpaA
VNRAVFGQRATIVASASEDGTARIWPLQGGDVQVLTGHNGPVHSIAVDRAGRRALTAGADGTARLWRVEAKRGQASASLCCSVQRRPIELVRVGSPLTGRRILVIGCMHGDACAGKAVVDRLERGSATGFELVLVRDLNPDGSKAGTRTNANGVDLNRNFPYRWTRSETGREYSGPAKLSEPESRIAAGLIRELEPDITIWYFAPGSPSKNPEAPPPWVNEAGGSVAIPQRYADLVGDLPLRRGLPIEPEGGYPGNAPSWQNQAFKAGTAFWVELPFGLTSGGARRHAQAVLALGNELP